MSEINNLKSDVRSAEQMIAIGIIFMIIITSVPILEIISIDLLFDKIKVFPSLMLMAIAIGGDFGIFSEIKKDYKKIKDCKMRLKEMCAEAL